MSAGGRRNGTRKYGHSSTQAGRHSARYTAELSTAQHKTARRAIKIVPVAAVAATLAAGTAAYGLTANGQANPAKLDAALSAPMILSAMSHGARSAGSAGTADGAKSAVLAPGASTPAAGSQTPGSPASQPAAQPSRVAAAPAATQPAVTQATQAPAAAAAPSSPSASASSTPAASTVSCSTSSSLLPENVTAIVSFLLANGYSHNAAAGIAGNIYQESKGDPESIGMGGGGLIGWTPLPSGFVTGNVPADLQTQLSALLTYNNGWSGYIPALNAAATPADAAYIYVTDFERAGIPAASTREASAEAVASACNL